MQNPDPFGAIEILVDGEERVEVQGQVLFDVEDQSGTEDPLVSRNFANTRDMMKRKKNDFKALKCKNKIFVTSIQLTKKNNILKLSLFLVLLVFTEKTVTKMIKKAVKTKFRSDI